MVVFSIVMFVFWGVISFSTHVICLSHRHHLRRHQTASNVLICHILNNIVATIFFTFIKYSTIFFIMSILPALMFTLLQYPLCHSQSLQKTPQSKHPLLPSESSSSPVSLVLHLGGGFPKYSNNQLTDN